MWVRRAAIRPVPPYARVPEGVLASIEDELSREGDAAKAEFEQLLSRFETLQPVLADRLNDTVSKPIEETALALGYFLGLSVWVAFDRTFGDRVSRVDETALKSVEEALALDEQIRLADPAEAVDSDDVIAMEQPHLCAFANEHIEAALEANADQADVNDVHAVFRVVLIEILALSYAVEPPAHLAAVPDAEFSA